MARARSSPDESGVRRAARSTVRFPVELRRVAGEHGVAPRLVADSPEEWRLGPATVVVDRRRGTAQVRYARETIARAGCDAEEVMSAWRRALDRLARDSLAPDALLPALAGAYAEVLADGGAPDGTRVVLAEMVAAVGRAAGRRTYSRAQFAWDIARLRRERRLQHDGRRVLLDVATGAAPVQRRRVVWIEDESGAGQYYGSFRLVAR
ncbi:MAG TPA: hypothetical protein VK698_38735 [Kofleriaceae bacterium]|nr:hypothetical protein [Kofleriaceae bacterium]